MKKENITPRNKNGDKHGYWKRYWSNGKLNHIRYYI
jgi:hypothetical protein